MKLTGKAKIDFEDWYLKQDYNTSCLADYSKEQVLKSFYAMYDSFKYGIIVDFFDSKNIFLSVDFETFEDCNKGLKVTISNYFCWVNQNLINNCRTRNEARKKGVNNANQLYNGF